jgi:hypothetical protein
MKTIFKKRYDEMMSLLLGLFSFLIIIFIPIIWIRKGFSFDLFSTMIIGILGLIMTISWITKKRAKGYYSNQIKQIIGDASVSEDAEDLRNMDDTTPVYKEKYNVYINSLSEEIVNLFF